MIAGNRNRQRRGPHAGPGRLLVLCVVALVLAGCGERGCGPVIARYHQASAKDLREPVKTHTLRASKKRSEPRPQKPPPPPVSTAPFEKVHPLLRRQVAGLPPAARVDVVVTLRDTIGPSVRALGLTKLDLRVALEARRDSLFDDVMADLDNDHDALEIARFWLIHALVLNLPVAEIDGLAGRPDVIRVESVLGGPPPQSGTWGVCGATDKNMDYARALVGSDAYVEAEYGGGIIALLDTGVYTGHRLIADGGRVGMLFGCSVNGCAPSTSGAQIDLWPSGHGTSSAAILAGESDAMPKDRGMTKAIVHSYSVYTHDASGNVVVDLIAAARAFESAMIGEASLCVVEIAIEEGGPGALTEAAGQMFEYDVMVVVANGNDGDDVPSPAGASCALGVGAFCPESQAYVHEYVEGLTGDGRWKPDLTATTSIYTAGNGAPDAMGNYGGTSGATPFVGGAALLLGNRMTHGGALVVPGNVYSTLLLAADDRADHIVAEEGAGRLRLPDDGQILWGTLEVADLEAWSLPIQVETDAAATIEALIWWPRSGVTATNQAAAGFADIDLYLFDDAGRQVASSLAVHEVREQTRGSISAGSAGKWWSAKVHGYSVPGDGTQTVYWAAWVRDAD